MPPLIAGAGKVGDLVSLVAACIKIIHRAHVHKEKYGVLLDEYIKDGFVECDGENYRFTSNGMFVSNYILSSVLDLGVSAK